jgi:hypothetical protein
LVGKVLMFVVGYVVLVAGLRWGVRGPLRGFASTVNPLYDGLTAGAEASKGVGFRLSLQ